MHAEEKEIEHGMRKARAAAYHASALLTGAPH